MNLSNICIFDGRAVRDAEVRFSQAGKPTARFTLAIDKEMKTENGANADFIGFVAFGKIAEFCEKYVNKGVRFKVFSHVQNNNYPNKEGKMVYTNDFIVDQIRFGESRKASQTANTAESKPASSGDDFVSVADSVSEEELPFG